VAHGGGPGRRSGTSYDAELQRHTAVLRRMWDVQPGEYVLDIGCGTGQTTREAARMARAGRALGVDISAVAIERARALARAERLGNVRFERADAQVHRFVPGRYDLAVSRFGTMFFHDPGAAFVNVARALRPAGRLVMLVWQASERIDSAANMHAHRRLRETLAAHLRDDGVWFDSRAWIVTAVRR
jgi:SAM-dependent methyltransferase